MSQNLIAKVKQMLVDHPESQTVLQELLTKLQKGQTQGVEAALKKLKEETW